MNPSESMTKFLVESSKLYIIINISFQIDIFHVKSLFQYGLKVWSGVKRNVRFNITHLWIFVTQFWITHCVKKYLIHTQLYWVHCNKYNTSWVFCQIYILIWSWEVGIFFLQNLKYVSSIYIKSSCNFDYLVNDNSRHKHKAKFF